MAMLAITDARFLDGLVAQAKRTGKLQARFSIPDRWRQNTPAHLHDALSPFQARGLFAAFPFGSDFSPEEQRLLPALPVAQETLPRYGGKGWSSGTRAAGRSRVAGGRVRVEAVGPGFTGRLSWERAAPIRGAGARGDALKSTLARKTEAPR
jgi:hypothetical protein